MTENEMVRIQFNKKNSRYKVNFKTVSPDVVQMTGKKIPKCTNGFKVYKMDGTFLGDYSAYTKIVAEVENGYQYGKEE